ncbi:hypothetical protein [Vibrio agarivorans]|uniref:hypothetical protein n=1 Tax=Vibrio agarivorans TaxID=153622 RepID=UPI0025B40D28|nr:hypothetical protein [Vibrio agarivorans]MDN3660359.1 hypothetical protein [Vibrio agarivorans]
MKKKVELCDFVAETVEPSYPNISLNEYRILLEISIYQDLRRYRSVPKSKSQKLQIELLEAFERQYPKVETARMVPLFDLGLYVQEWVTAETHNHSFGFECDGISVGHAVVEGADSFGIDHWLYCNLPRGERATANTNRAQELKRVAIEYLAPLLTQLDLDSACDKALYHVIVSEVLTIKSSRIEDLSAYLYGASHALLVDGLSKHESFNCAAALSQALEQVNGFSPEPMGTIWRLGLGYSDALIERYDKLMASLKPNEDSILSHYDETGVRVEIWRYPDIAQTLRVYNLDEDGNCCLIDAESNVRRGHE